MLFIFEGREVNMRFLCVIIGYLFGCFLTAEIVARHNTGKRAFEIGTGNPGMANICTQLGAKCAALTLLGDVMKTVLPCMLCRFILFPSLGRDGILYAGFGATLGHGFPFWNKFHGGKGVAVTCTYIILFSPLIGLLVEIIGLCAVLVTKYLTVGSLLIPTLFLFPVFRNYGLEAGLVALAGTALIFFLNRRSLLRIIHKSETKVDLLKKFKSC